MTYPNAHNNNNNNNMQRVQTSFTAWFEEHEMVVPSVSLNSLLTAYGAIIHGQHWHQDITWTDIN